MNSRGRIPGLIKRGNIDTRHRPEVRNPNGSVSTVRSMTFTGPKGRATLLPSVIPDPINPARFMVGTPQLALRQYRRTGQQLGTFKNEQTADAYARSLHRAQAAAPPRYPTLGASAGVRASKPKKSLPLFLSRGTMSGHKETPAQFAFRHLPVPESKAQSHYHNQLSLYQAGRRATAPRRP